MAVIIGGTDAFPGRDNRLIGSDERDYVYGDPFTTGAEGFDEFGNPIEIPQIGGVLSSGRGGNDRIEGRDGFINVRSGSDEEDPLFRLGDFLYGDAEKMRGTGKGGNDYLDGGQDGDFLIGDAYEMAGKARGGQDILIGGEGDDGLFDPSDFEPFDAYGLHGDAVWMHGRARGGSDRLLGGEGADRLIGDAEGMTDNTKGGQDILIGGGGDDRLYGDAISVSGGARCGDDKLLGGNGSDILYGDALRISDITYGGDDRLTGGKGDDLLYGDADPTEGNFADVVRGADTFVIRRGDGHDTIGDFEPGKDKIVFEGFGELGAADVLGDGTRFGARVLDSSGHGSGGLVLDLGGNSVTLLGVTDLSGSDLVFG